jgi:hypothetical protein
MLGPFQKELIKEDWSVDEGHRQIQLKLLARDQELYVLTRSLDRAEKERAIRLRALHGLRKDLAKLGKTVRSGRVRRRRDDDGFRSPVPYPHQCIPGRQRK